MISEIIPPVPDTEIPPLMLDPVSTKEYEGTYSDFTQNGKYTIFISAEAVDGISVSYEPIYVHVGEKTPYDVNGDGVVDIGDLVIIGSHLGESGDDVQGDVNGDGEVDISDLVLIGSHFSP